MPRPFDAGCGCADNSGAGRRRRKSRSLRLAWILDRPAAISRVILVESGPSTGAGVLRDCTGSGVVARRLHYGSRAATEAPQAGPTWSRLQPGDSSGDLAAGLTWTRLRPRQPAPGTFLCSTRRSEPRPRCCGPCQGVASGACIQALLSLSPELLRRFPRSAMLLPVY